MSFMQEWQQVQKKTSQINADEFEGYFRSFSEQGLDVLHVCRSSGITGVIGQVFGICPLLNMDYLGRLTHDIKSERKKSVQSYC